MSLSNPWPALKLQTLPLTLLLLVALACRCLTGTTSAQSADADKQVQAMQKLMAKFQATYEAGAAEIRKREHREPTPQEMSALMAEASKVLENRAPTTPPAVGAPQPDNQNPFAVLAPPPPPFDNKCVVTLTITVKTMEVDTLDPLNDNRDYRVEQKMLADGFQDGIPAAETEVMLLPDDGLGELLQKRAAAAKTNNATFLEIFDHQIRLAESEPTPAELLFQRSLGNQIYASYNDPWELRWKERTTDSMNTPLGPFRNTGSDDKLATPAKLHSRIVLGRTGSDGVLRCNLTNWFHGGVVVFATPGKARFTSYIRLEIPQNLENVVCSITNLICTARRILPAQPEHLETLSNGQRVIIPASTESKRQWAFASETDETRGERAMANLALVKAAHRNAERQSDFAEQQRQKAWATASAAMEEEHRKMGNGSSNKGVDSEGMATELRQLDIRMQAELEKIPEVVVEAGSGAATFAGAGAVSARNARERAAIRATWAASRDAIIRRYNRGQ